MPGYEIGYELSLVGLYIAKDYPVRSFVVCCPIYGYRTAFCASGRTVESGPAL